MSNTNDFRAETASIFRYRRRRGQGRAGDFEQNLCLKPQRAVHCHQSAPGGDIHSRGKFEKVLTVRLLTSDKYRNCEREPYPRASFHFRLSAIQPKRPLTRFSRSNRTYWAKQIAQ
jgi:hypothetical protein